MTSPDQSRADRAAQGRIVSTLDAHFSPFFERKPTYHSTPSLTHGWVMEAVAASGHVDEGLVALVDRRPGRGGTWGRILIT
jgi:hypothetical protein